jgi:phage terminase Nu1 subunit (DNA packaging protein)
MRELVSLRKGAAALGIALSTLQHHVAAGNVRLVNGKVDVDAARAQLRANRDPVQSMRARRGRSSDNGGSPSSVEYYQHRARLTKAQADKTQLEAAEMRGEVVRVDEAIEHWTARLQAFRARLLGTPNKVAPLIGSCQSVEDAERLIREEILEALDELDGDPLPPRVQQRRVAAERVG